MVDTVLAEAFFAQRHSRTLEALYNYLEPNVSCEILKRHSILRRREVERLTGLSRSTIYANIATGKFPKPISLGDRAIGFVAAEIEDWLQKRIDQRDLAQQVRS
jgi:prophage regulatory protein